MSFHILKMKTYLKKEPHFKMKTYLEKEPHFENENRGTQIKSKEVWQNLTNLCFTVFQKCGAINDEW